VSRLTTEHASRTAPRPVGGQKILNPKLSRRGFLAGTAALPIATEAVFAGTAVSMSLELDLSSDGGTLTVREFPRPAPGQKPDEGSQRKWSAIAAAFGPEAWFDLTVDADDDNLKHLRIRDARYGATGSINLELFFLPVLSPDKTRVDISRPRVDVLRRMALSACDHDLDGECDVDRFAVHPGLRSVLPARVPVCARELSDPMT
jgi:hypothetical protein